MSTCGLYVAASRGTYVSIVGPKRCMSCPDTGRCSFVTVSEKKVKGHLAQERLYEIRAIQTVCDRSSYMS